MTDQFTSLTPTAIKEIIVHLDESILIVLDFKKILSLDEKEALDGVTRLIPEELEA